MENKRALIFANGVELDDKAILGLIRSEDFKIAADGGLHHIIRLGLMPDLLIGDLDSVEPAEVDALRNNGVRIQQYPTHKDETDLELAVSAALREGCTTVFILGALGGRLDMTLANIFLLDLPELANIDARLEDGCEEVFFIRPGSQEHIIEGKEGDRVSLLPLGGPARGVTTRGLYYPLRGETLYPERTRGISNVMLDSQAHVMLEAGQLICIHTRTSSKKFQSHKVG